MVPLTSFNVINTMIKHNNIPKLPVIKETQLLSIRTTTSFILTSQQFPRGYLLHSFSFGAL